MPGPILLEVNHVEMLEDQGMEWSMTCEEVLGGSGRATLTVQDRTNTWEPECHWDVKLSIRATGWVLFRGEIITEPLELPLHREWRSWKLDCADYNNEFEQRLIGAFNGKIWQDVDGLGDYVNLDPTAPTLATDKLTVQRWFDAYIRVDGQAFETDTYVGEFLTDFPVFTPSYSTLQRSLEDLAKEIADNLQFWGDPDLYFHWVTIPPWQDLTPGGLSPWGFKAVDPDSTSSMLPEGDLSLLPESPYHISDIRDDADAQQIGAAKLAPTYDGSAMPEQIYVRGATGYVYNAPAVNPVGDTVTVTPQQEVVHVNERFRVTFLASTKIWQKLSNGLISSTYITVGASGPYDAKLIVVAYNPTNGKGGHFFQLLTGPYIGKLVDNDTNYFGYGLIKVEKYIETVTEPSVGIGGSGFVGEVLQDKNKRQAYLEVAISDNQEKRDTIGGQAQYRAQFPTLRGTVTVNGKEFADGQRISADGWRAGQVVLIEDDRLPSKLRATGFRGRAFLIQKVSTSLLEGTDIREYDLDFGDGPSSRYSYEPPQAGGDANWPPPAVLFEIEARDLAPGPSTKQTIVGQLKAKDGTAWEIPGKVVKWSLEVYNSGGSLVDEGKLTPEVSATDAHGKARTTLTTGPSTGLTYFVFGDVPVQQ